MKKKNKVVATEIAAPKSQLFENSIWMTVQDTARYLSRTENAVRILMSRGILRIYRLGRRVYLKRSDIDILLESSVLTNGGY
jgi:excisionase family DNA binding protein